MAGHPLRPEGEGRRRSEGERGDDSALDTQSSRHLSELMDMQLAIEAEV